VYILGYGFDRNNSERLGLREGLAYEKADNVKVMFTNFNNINRVNKRASRLLFRTARHFSPAGGAVEESDGRYERSIRDVYEALELDFESLEEA
jgi:hypothetical protein